MALYVWLIGPLFGIGFGQDPEERMQPNLFVMWFNQILAGTGAGIAAFLLMKGGEAIRYGASAAAMGVGFSAVFIASLVAMAQVEDSMDLSGFVYLSEILGIVPAFVGASLLMLLAPNLRRRIQTRDWRLRPLSMLRNSLAVVGGLLILGAQIPLLFLLESEAQACESYDEDECAPRPDLGNPGLLSTLIPLAVAVAGFFLVAGAYGANRSLHGLPFVRAAGWARLRRTFVWGSAISAALVLIAIALLPTPQPRGDAYSVLGTARVLVVAMLLVALAGVAIFGGLWAAGAASVRRQG